MKTIETRIRHIIILESRIDFICFILLFSGLCFCRGSRSKVKTVSPNFSRGKLWENNYIRGWEKAEYKKSIVKYLAINIVSFELLREL